MSTVLAISAAQPSGIGFGVVALTLSAAVLHATWNAIAHGVADRLIGFTWIGIAFTVLSGAAVLALGPPPAAAWPSILISAPIHVAYQSLLLVSYRLGEFSQVYPVARGTAPWVVAVAEIVLLGHHLPTLELVGVLVISLGLFGLVSAGGRPSRKQVPALLAAFATGLCIASYTVVDAVGVQQAPVLTYSAWLFLFQGPALPLVAVFSRGRALPRQLQPGALIGFTGGVISLAAYVLVLIAQTSGATAAIAALRETSIVIGALIGTLFFGERFGWGRTVAAAVVTTGIVLINLAF